MGANRHEAALTILTTWRLHDAIVTTCGDIDITTVGRLTERLAEVLQIQPRQLIIDLAGSRYVDAAGCRALARIARALPPGHTLTLRSPSRIACRIFSITGLDQLCRIEPSAPSRTIAAPGTMAAPHTATVAGPDRG